MARTFLSRITRLADNLLAFRSASNPRNTYHSRLRCEPLEDRRLLSIGLSNVAITSAINEDSVAHLTGNITDPCPQDTFVLTVDWGDGSSSQDFNYPAGTTTFDETHQYMDQPAGVQSGTFNVSLSLATPVGTGDPAYVDDFLYGGSGDQRGTAITAVGDALYIAGTANNAIGILGSYSTSTGSQNWLDTLDATTSLSGVAVADTTVAAVGSATPPAYGASDGSGSTEPKVLFATCDTSGSSLAGNSTNIFGYRGGEGYNAVAAAVEGGATYFYATGNAQYDGDNNTAVLAKYDAAGNLLWTKALGSTASLSNSSGAGVAVLNGCVYVSGYSHSPYTDANAIRTTLWRYDPADDSLASWSTTEASGTAVLCAAGDYLYLAAPLGATTAQKDVLLMKFDGDGALVWSNTWGDAAVDDIPYGIAADGDRIYVTGETAASGYGGKDVFLLQADTCNGTVLSSDFYGGAQDDVGRGVAISGHDVYVIGQLRSFASLDGNLVGEDDVLFLKYSVGSSTATAATTITVDNVAPSNLTVGMSPTTIDENGVSTLSGTFTDPGTLDTHTVTIDWGDGSASTILNLAVGVTTIPDTPHQYHDNLPNDAPYTVTVTAADKDGASTQSTTAVTVNNVAPTAAFSSPPTSVAVATPTSFTVTADEPGPVDAAGLTYEVNWGDGSGWVPYAAPASGVTVSHVWTSFGDYTVSVRATDNDLVTGLTATCAINVPYVDTPTINADAFSANANNGINLAISTGNLVVTVDGVVVLSVPAGSLNGIQINGQTGNDTLTVDFGSGNPIPTGGISYDGGAGGDDALVVTGGSFNTVTYDFDAGVSTVDHSGGIHLDGSYIAYAGLLPILGNVGTATDVIFNLPNVPTNLVSLRAARYPAICNSTATIACLKTPTFPSPPAR